MAGRPCNSISQWRRLAQKSPTKSFLDINCIGFSLGAYRSEVVDFLQASNHQSRRARGGGAGAVCRGRLLRSDPCPQHNQRQQQLLWPRRSGNRMTGQSSFGCHSGCGIAVEMAVFFVLCIGLLLQHSVRCRCNASSVVDATFRSSDMQRVVGCRCNDSLLCMCRLLMSECQQLCNASTPPQVLSMTNCEKRKLTP